MGRWGCHRDKISLREPVHDGVAEIWKNNLNSDKEKSQGEVKLCAHLPPEPSLELQWTTRLIEPGEKQSKVTILSLVAQTQAHQILWPVPQVVTLEGSRTAAPAAYRSWAALPWSPLGHLMATVNLNNKKWLRSLIFYFSKWRILVVWIEAYDQLCTILRGAHKQPAMLWLKSSSWYPAVRVALLNCQTGLWEEHQISHT